MTLKLSIAFIFILGNLMPLSIYAMDEITEEDTVYREINTNGKSRRARRGAGYRQKMKLSEPEMVDKFNTEEEISASESPEGTTFGESN